MLWILLLINRYVYNRPFNYLKSNIFLKCFAALCGYKFINLNSNSQPSSDRIPRLLWQLSSCFVVTFFTCTLLRQFFYMLSFPELYFFYKYKIALP